MKKFLRNLALVCATLFAYQTANSQTVAVTADLKTMFGGAAATKTQVCMSLVDGNGNQLSNPRTSGGVIVPTATQCVLPDGSGHVATTAIANDQITPSGSVYSITYLYNGRSVHGDTYQFLLADGTENLNTKIGLNTPPVVPAPTGDTTYGRLDGANFPFTAPINTIVGYEISSAAPSGHYLRGNGTNYVDSTPLFSDFLNQGTTTTVLHGNAAGNSSFSSIVQGDVNNGYVDLSSAQNVGGVKTLTSDTLLKSTNGLAIVKADQFSSVQAAMNACPAAGCVVDARSPNTNLTLGALDTGSNTKIITLLLGPYTYTFTQITVRQGFNILGAGFLDTVLSNVGTNANPAFVIPQVNNNAITVHWSDFQVTALAGNTSQDGIFFDGSTLTNAGVELSTFTNIQLTGFNGAGIHLKATLNGSSGSIGAIQGITFTNVTSIRPTGATGATQNALRIEGGVGQIEFINCWFTGATNDTGTNVFVGTSGTQAPYSIHFHGTTNQNGNAYLFDGGTSYSTENDHCENIKGMYTLQTTSQLLVGVNIKTPHINANCGVNAGNGFVVNIPNTAINVDGVLDTPLVYATPDKLVNNQSGNNASFRPINARTFNSSTPTNVYATVGVTGTLNAAATVDLKSWDTIFVNASATSMTTLKSTKSPGENTTLCATGGTVQFALGGNLSLGNNLSPFILQSGDCATFTRVDQGTPVFVLTGYTRDATINVDLTGQTANIGSTLLYAIPATGAGTYRITVYIIVTSVGTTSTMPAVVFAYTDKDNNTAQSVPFTVSNAGNTLTTLALNSLPISAKASTNINYSTNSYASTGSAMQYALHIKLEYLGQ